MSVSNPFSEIGTVINVSNIVRSAEITGDVINLDIIVVPRVTVDGIVINVS